MKYYIKIDEYTTERLPPNSESPKPQNLQYKRRDTFLYDNGVLQSAGHGTDPDYKEFSSAGVFLTEVPNDVNATAFFTTDCHPVPTPEKPREREAWGTWCELGFRSEDIRLVLDHIGENKFDADVERGPTWVKLFSGTKHLTEATASCAQILSGRLAIFWGLVALQFGSQYMDNLGTYFVNQNSMNWPRDHEPDRTPGRVVAVTIYRSPTTSPEELENMDLLV